MNPVCAACRVAPATLFCQADAAYLCPVCDTQIHSANKLSRRHTRVPLLPTTPSTDTRLDSSESSVVVPDADDAASFSEELASIAGIFVKREAEELLARSRALDVALEPLVPQLDALAPEEIGPLEDFAHATSDEELEVQRRRDRQAALKRFRTKRANRSFRKKVRYQCRKQLADSRPRVKGRFVGSKGLGGVGT